MSDHITRFNEVKVNAPPSSWHASWKPRNVSPLCSQAFNHKSADATTGESDALLVKHALEKAYKDLSDRFKEMLLAVEKESTNAPSSLLVKSCRASLSDDVPLLLDEFRLLMLDGDNTFTVWRVAGTRVAADLLLDTIQAALLHPQRSTLEEKLKSMVQVISSQIRYGKTDSEMKDIGFTVSPRKMPSLAFQVAVGMPIRYDLVDEESKTNDDDLCPIKLRVQPIVEILSQDLVENEETPAKVRQACRVQIDKIRHTSAVVGGGFLGVGFLQVIVSSMAEQDASVHVKEARCLQRNAFPPRPKTSVDIYSSAKQGSSDVTLTFKFQTFATLKNEAPEMRIDLIMGSV